MKSVRDKIRKELKEEWVRSFDCIFTDLEREMNSRLTITLLFDLTVSISAGDGSGPFMEKSLSSIIDESIEGFEEWIPGIIENLEKEIVRLRKKIKE